MFTVLSRGRVAGLVLLVLALAFAPSVSSQNTTPFEAGLRRAIEMVQAGRIEEALPLLERLYMEKPDEPLVLENLAFALTAIALPDNSNPDQRKATLARVHQLAEKAASLGHSSPLIQTLLKQIPADGNVQAWTGPAKNAAAQQALDMGEDAFSRGQLQAAIEHYQRAFKLEPTLYEAPLFIGDAYFGLGQIKQAGEYYAKAIAIDRDRDTAYRYWGDVLLRANRLKEAREKFVEAVIADPYTSKPWEFLARWAQKAHVDLSHPRIDIPPSPISKGADNNITILVPFPDAESRDGSDAWITYGIIKGGWAAGQEVFKKAYPDETVYRHSLQEEVMALEAAVQFVKTRLKKGELKEADLNVSIVNLLKVHKAGLLEPYVLFAMPDEEIAQDYVEYRSRNRGKLRRYLNEFVTASK